MSQRHVLIAAEISNSLHSQQVDYHAFLADDSAVDADHALALSVELIETRIHCNHPGVEINGEAIDLIPQVTLRLASYKGSLVPPDRNHQLPLWRGFVPDRATLRRVETGQTGRRDSTLLRFQAQRRHNHGHSQR
jgi:hypothetical protein